MVSLRFLVFRGVLLLGLSVLGLSVLGLAVLSGTLLRPAAAQSVDLPPAAFKALPEGTRMVWENLDSGKRVEGLVGRTNGYIVSWIWEGRSFASFAHVCMDCVTAGVPPGGGVLGQLFPLQVGKAVNFTRRWAGEAWRDRIEVLGTERVTVPAGTYDTFVLLRRSVLVGKDWQAEQRTWYAPELGWVVKFEGYNTKGAGERWQAVAFD
ncbi:MAG: hypothetical protein RH942_02595 [Kiloniellaceae bacterium]